MERIKDQQLAMMPIEFKLNGQTVIGRPDEPIITTAQKHGVEVPHLCHGGNQRSDGNCRACVVEIKGERTLAPSCCRFPVAGMEVTTNSPRALASQKMVLELLLSDMPEQEYTLDNKLKSWAKKIGVHKPRFPRREQPRSDLSHPAIAGCERSAFGCSRRAKRGLPTSSAAAQSFSLLSSVYSCSGWSESRSSSTIFCEVSARSE
ncbi:MAG TPA: 2Fe-2S iron-sulfur cluster-binding protein, partial [Burkholderiales bacterium]|nr:2Fe-2S iron-sulfur cluster-binding protein [Burkholderiales bacterium]